MWHTQGMVGQEKISTRIISYVVLSSLLVLAVACTDADAGDTPASVEIMASERNVATVYADMTAGITPAPPTPTVAPPAPTATKVPVSGRMAARARGESDSVKVDSDRTRAWEGSNAYLLAGLLALAVVIAWLWIRHLNIGNNQNVLTEQSQGARTAAPAPAPAPTPNEVTNSASSSTAQRTGITYNERAIYIGILAVLVLMVFWMFTRVGSLEDEFKSSNTRDTAQVTPERDCSRGCGNTVIREPTPRAVPRGLSSLELFNQEQKEWWEEEARRQLENDAIKQRWELDKMKRDLENLKREASPLFPEDPMSWE